MHKYTVIYERADDGGWGAYVPDLPGLGIVAETREEARKLIAEGVSLHIAGLKEDGLAIPEPNSFADQVEVAA
jgi:predicted RNase H-like HicB family nuclease